VILVGYMGFIESRSGQHGAGEEDAGNRTQSWWTLAMEEMISFQ